jgi:hypothetical protein
MFLNVQPPVQPQIANRYRVKISFLHARPLDEQVQNLNRAEPPHTFPALAGSGQMQDQRVDLINGLKFFRSRTEKLGCRSRPSFSRRRMVAYTWRMRVWLPHHRQLRSNAGRPARRSRESQPVSHV